MLATLNNLIVVTLNAVVLVSSALVAGFMLLLVLSRYVFGWSILGLHEWILLFALQLYMAGALIASHHGEHLTVNFLQQKLASPKSMAAHKIAIGVITAVICGFFIVWSYWMFSWGVKRPQVTPVLNIPIWIPQISIMVAAVGSLACALRDVLFGIQMWRHQK